MMPQLAAIFLFCFPAGAVAAPLTIHNPQALARATIPVKSGKGYRKVSSVVSAAHVIHDPLFPIEGAGWESDRIGYRVDLDKRNAVDIYGKKRPAAVLHRIGQGNGSYHEEVAWGMDIWRVGDSLGAGASACCATTWRRRSAI
ncbi:MAG: DUF4861 family protein [Alphaproteobacteria bacterium]|nr:DUF4861 family protein [Alphaproteobacteria bacterium]